MFLHYSLFHRLTIDPCGQCWGNTSVMVKLIDHPDLATITPAASTATIQIEIRQMDDAPNIFLFSSDNELLLHPDPTEPVLVCEQIKYLHSFVTIL